ncbi:MAG TPA: alpha/beta hydrolase [Solirubrobacter sp.]
MSGSLEQRIREAEAELFAGVGAEVEESWLDLTTLGLQVRVLSHGSGVPVVLLHGVSLSAAVWVPLVPALNGYRLLAVDLPGHGLSDPFAFRRGQVRAHAQQLLDDIFDALELERANVIGHSLGGMFALWHAARDAERIRSLIALGDPAVALPGTRVRMPLSLLTVRGVGRTVLRSPSPRPVFRHMLAHGLGHAEIATAPAALVEALRLAGRRSGNARTIASLMHAIDAFRRPRPESVLTGAELTAIVTPTMFVWGTDDPYLSPADARPSIQQMPNATLHELPAGHGPWLVHPGRTAELIQTQLGGFVPSG